MKFSIIIPLYNCEDYISKCLSSIINQNYENLEIIVVNDGSTDNSSSIVKDFMKKDDRIFLFNNKNHGVSFSRNFGISKATGDYLHFVDADDVVVSGLYEYVNNLLNINNYDFVRFNYNFEDNGHFIENKEYKFSDIEVNNQFIVESLIPLILDEKIKAYVWQLIIKNCDVPRFNLDLKILEDEKFCLELFSSCKKGYITSQIFYSYNISNINSATKSYSKIKLMMENMLLANEKIKSVLHDYNLDSEKNLTILDSRMAHSYSNYLEILYRSSGDFKLAVNEFSSIANIKNLKNIFVNLNYDLLNNKHKITTYLTLNKHFLFLHILYFLKKIIGG